MKAVLMEVTGQDWSFSSFYCHRGQHFAETDLSDFLVWANGIGEHGGKIDPLTNGQFLAHMREATDDGEGGRSHVKKMNDVV